MMTIRKTLLAAAAAAPLALGASAALADSHGECGEVSITEMNWASSAVVTAVAKFLMEQGYGCTVNTVPSSTNPALTSVAETGEPDILTELWVTATPAYHKLAEEGKVQPLTDVLSDGGVEGWWIPTYLAEEHPELATIEGVLANPELVGNRFHQCPDGWACKTVNGNLVTAAGTEEAGIETFVHGSGETLATSIASAYENEEPWLGYYWAPTSVLGKYPMTLVDFGTYDEEAHQCNGQDVCPDPQISNYPQSKVLTVVTTEFQESNPEITELMSKVQFTNAQMGEILAWQEENGASGEESAVYFLTNYKDVWSDWLSDEARDKLSALISG